jgi:hypothetical protein
MTRLRYHRREISTDLLRAGAGLAACVTPMFFLEPGAVASYVLAVPAAFFALFGVRTVTNARTVFTFDETGIRAEGGHRANIRWDGLHDVRLSYFSTRRDREAGWMQLKLEGAESTLNLHSSLDGFEDVCRAAFLAAESCGLDLTAASTRNFTMLGLGAAAPTTPFTPAALSGWGNPADWRR